MIPRVLPILASLLCCLLLAACTAAPDKPLRLGTNVWIGYEPFYLAREINALDQDKVRLVEYTSSLPVLNAFRNGLLDAAALTLDESLVLTTQMPDLTVVAVLDISNGADALLARPNIHSISELKNKAVAVENLATGGYLLMRALQHSGIALTDVTIQTEAADRHERILDKGDIAAVVTYDPHKSQLLAAGMRSLFDSSQIPGEIVDVLVVRSQLLREKPTQLQHLIKAWFIAQGHLQRNRHDALIKMQARQRLNAEQLNLSLTQLRFPSQQENIALLTDPEKLSTTTRLLQQHMLHNGLLPNNKAPLLKLDAAWIMGR